MLFKPRLLNAVSTGQGQEELRPPLSPRAWLRTPRHPLSLALWWGQPRQGRPSWPLCTSSVPRTGHGGQADGRPVRIKDFEHPPHPYGLLKTGRLVGMSPLCRGARDRLQSWTLPRKPTSPVHIVVITGRLPPLRTLKETSRSVRWPRPSTSPGLRRCGCRSLPRRLPAARAPACPGRRSCTWPRPCQ